MVRFMLNRRMTLTLALFVCLMVGPHMGAPAYAILYNDIPKVGDGEGGAGGTPRGDPDLPTGSTRTVRTGTQWVGSSTLASRPAGDGSVASRAWVWRLRIVLRNLQAFYLHF